MTCHNCEELVLFTEIEEHEEWCKKIKCANKTCQTILEYRHRKEFKLSDEKTIQVCDDVCYQMYQLQSALKKQDNMTVLAFIDEYFQEEQEDMTQSDRPRVQCKLIQKEEEKKSRALVAS